MNDTEKTSNENILKLLGPELYAMMRATIAAHIANYNRTVGETNAKYNRIIWKR